MLTSTTLQLLTLAGLATASPVKIARQEGGTQYDPAWYPGRVYSTTWTLRANFTDPAKLAAVFPNTDLNNWFVSSTHSGAGKRTAVLRPDAGVAEVFFYNGSNNRPRDSGEVLTRPVHLDFQDKAVAQGVQWYTVTSEGTKCKASSTRTEMQINFSGGDKGTGVGSGFNDPYARFYGPHGTGFMVCNEASPYQYTVLAVGYQDVVPDNCAPMALLAQWDGEFEPALEQKDIDDLYLDIGQVQAYAEVTAIDWSEWPKRPVQN